MTVVEPPVFIVAAPRSGTTLLRTLLDAHPEIGCPSETGVATLAAALERAWRAICSDVAGEHVETLPGPVLRKIRSSVRAPMDHYCAQTGKRIYCDKSLDTPDHLESLGRVFPGARYIVLGRHVFDVVESALEVSPYGFSAFGYAPYVQHSVGNFVAPLVEHWIARVRPGIVWSRTHPGDCHIVRYEDLVTDPTRVLLEIFSFMGVSADLGVIESAFRHAPNPQARGDAKIGFTSAIHSDSVGRGKRIPLDLVPPLLMAEANELLALLGYPRVTAEWNFQSATVAARPMGKQLSLQKIMPTHIDASGLSDADDIALVVEDVEALGWSIELRGGRLTRTTGGSAEVTLHGTEQTFVDVLLRRENPAMLFADGRLRLSGPGARRRAVSTDVVELLRALQTAVASSLGGGADKSTVSPG